MLARIFFVYEKVDLNYYVLEHDPRYGSSLDETARTLGVEVVEQAGELVNHWLVRVTKGLQ